MGFLIYVFLFIWIALFIVAVLAYWRYIFKLVNKFAKITSYPGGGRVGLGTGHSLPIVGTNLFVNDKHRFLSRIANLFGDVIINLFTLVGFLVVLLVFYYLSRVLYDWLH